MLYILDAKGWENVIKVFKLDEHENAIIGKYKYLGTVLDTRLVFDVIYILFTISISTLSCVIFKKGFRNDTSTKLYTAGIV